MAAHSHWKRSFHLNVIAVLILGIRGASLLADSSSIDGPRLDVTRLFSFEANSTCGGEPPTPFENRFGELLNCSVDEFDARFAVDGDPNTRWQSQNGDDPVVLTFTSSEVSGRVLWLNLNVVPVIVCQSHYIADQHVSHSGVDQPVCNTLCSSNASFRCQSSWLQ